MSFQEKSKGIFIKEPKVQKPECKSALKMIHQKGAESIEKMIKASCKLVHTDPEEFPARFMHGRDINSRSMFCWRD